MTEHILRINVTELTRVRLSCPGCRIAIEVDADELHKITKRGKCPQCGQDWPQRQGPDPYHELSDGLRKLREDADRLGVEFVISAAPPQP